MRFFVVEINQSCTIILVLNKKKKPAKLKSTVQIVLDNCLTLADKILRCSYFWLSKNNIVALISIVTETLPVSV